MSGGGILSAIIIGILAGWIAEKVMKRDHGLFTNLIVGLIGALIGNWVGNAFFGVGGPIGEFSLTGFIVAIVGAVILLAIANLVQRGRVR